jgi:molecular chaperone GrpE (heat shock protein)
MAREAIESIKIQFMKILIDYGVEENIPSVGDKFDPTAHNALFEMQPTKPGDMVHTIGSVFKNGWTRKGALIRAAQVGVFNRSFEDNAAGDATPKSAPSQQEPTPEAPNL